jgi:hypothetical protein
MKEKFYLNGVEVKRSEQFEIPADRMKVDFPLSNKGELNFTFEPNWLWKRKQKTGIPKRVEVLPW